MCRHCKNDYQRAYRDNNRDKINARGREHYRNNREKQRAYQAQYFQNVIKSRRMEKLFGITFEQYEEMLKKQKGVCIICCEPCSSGKRLAIDHDHATGTVRGLLCNRCNRFIGLARDNRLILRRAISYLSEDFSNRPRIPA
jgi:hypothetical protein